MADLGKVIAYPGHGRAGGGHLVRLEALSATVRQLDELGCRLQEFSPQPGWPPQRWMIASTPFRLRLSGVRKRLGDLAMSPAAEQCAIHWALKFNDVRIKADQRLHDIDTSLRTLQCTDASPAERARETEVFTASRSEFMRILGEIRNLITERFLSP
jgi:hypothetical protein